MNSSRSSIPEALQPPGENLQLRSTVENNPAEATLPPFKVLLQWLSFYHEQTGAWPAPEEYKEDQSVIRPHLQRSEDKPHLKVLPGKPVTGRPECKFNDLSCYDYKSSIYYQEALELVAKHVPAARSLNEASVLTLSSILAWCNYPVFLTEFKDKIKDYGSGMYLPLSWWSKELKIRKATLGACLKELEGAGLVEIKIPDFKKGTAVNRFYRVAVLLKNSLPVFNPAETKPTLIPAVQLDDYQPQAHQEPLKRPAEPLLGAVPRVGTKTEQSSPMFMSSQNQINKFKDIKPENHEHADSHLEPGTIAEKVEFLSQKAIFPGYSSPDGLKALDSREAIKFASNPALDLFTIKRIYHQVLSAWSDGKCSKNPIGFFHHSLTQFLKKANASLNTSDHLEAAVPSRRREPSLLAVPSNDGSRSHHPNNSKINNKNRVRHSPVHYPTEDLNGQTAFAAPENLTALKYSNLEEETDKLGITQVDITKVQQDLKESVIEALQNRFRQPELAGKLGRLNWVVCYCPGDEGEGLQLRLESLQSDFLLASTFSQSDFSLLKIAISQILKSYNINTKKIEIWFENSLLQS